MFSTLKAHVHAASIALQLKEAKLETERMGRIKQSDLSFLNITTRIKRFSAIHSPWVLKFLSLTTLFLLNIGQPFHMLSEMIDIKSR
jgi:hypothetical protein